MIVSLTPNLSPMKNFLSIRIDLLDREKMTTAAKQLGFSRSQLVRNAVNLYLEQQKTAS